MLCENMSSTVPFRVLLHITIVFTYVLVCEGRLLHIGQPGHQGNDSGEGKTSLHQEPTIIEFPGLDEMTSEERAENRQRARKVATIIEKSLHMIADDILQMWAIIQTEKAEAAAADVEGNGVTEGQGEAETAGAQTAEVASAEITKKTKAVKTAEQGVKTTDGPEAMTTAGAGATATKMAGVKTTNGPETKTIARAANDEREDEDDNDVMQLKKIDVFKNPTIRFGRRRQGAGKLSEDSVVPTA